MRSMKNNISSSIIKNTISNSHNKHRRRLHHDSHPLSSNKSHNHCFHHLRSTLALNVEHELQSKNRFAASNLEEGWIIDSGASAHMTPFKKNCNSIINT